ncbi:MAG: hypothetical protein ABIR51_03770 [Sphingomicrobium sp.]
MTYAIAIVVVAALIVGAPVLAQDATGVAMNGVSPAGTVAAPAPPPRPRIGKTLQSIIDAINAPRPVVIAPAPEPVSPVVKPSPAVPSYTPVAVVPASPVVVPTKPRPKSVQSAPRAIPAVKPRPVQAPVKHAQQPRAGPVVAAPPPEPPPIAEAAPPPPIAATPPPVAEIAPAPSPVAAPVTLARRPPAWVLLLIATLAAAAAVGLARWRKVRRIARTRAALAFSPRVDWGAGAAEPRGFGLAGPAVTIRARVDWGEATNG